MTRTLERYQQEASVSIADSYVANKGYWGKISSKTISSAYYSKDRHSADRYRALKRCEDSSSIMVSLCLGPEVS